MHHVASEIREEDKKRSIKMLVRIILISGGGDGFFLMQQGLSIGYLANIGDAYATKDYEAQSAPQPTYE
jgi:hypothetical protein